MNRLVLIDGNAILHRAYHALPPLTAPDGSVVNAVYGFGTMLLRLIGDLVPTHVAVAFDMPKPTFRKKLFEGYQAKRPKMDEELVDQIPKVHALVSGFGIPIFEKDGFEADDIIGTIAKHAKKDGIDQVIIVTGDRDILQLVEDEKILVWMPTKGLSEAKLYGEKEVKERMGVAPDKVPDLKALAGDPSDNYAGVAGIGPKTAADLVLTFGSVDALYDALKKKSVKAKALSDTLIARLEAGRENALLSHDLATIRTNVPLEGALEPLGSLNRQEAVSVLTTLGFRSLLKRITGEANAEEGIKKVKKPDTQQQELF
jgi:DNA polymerase-1